MIIFLYGVDTYRLHEEARHILGQYKTKHPSGMNFIACDAGKPDERVALEDALRTVSFFDEVKLVRLENAFSSPFVARGILDTLERYGARDSKAVTVLAVAQGGGKDLRAVNAELFILLSQNKKLTKEFSPLIGIRLRQWVMAECTKRGCRMDTRAADVLIGRTGPDAWRVSHELDKLAGFRNSIGVVTSGDVEMLVSGVEGRNIFAFTDALCGGHTARALVLLYEEFFAGRNPHELLSLIASQFRNMLVVKDLAARAVPLPAITKRAGLHPFVARKAYAHVARMDLADLRRRYAELFSIEISAKRGTRDIEDALYDFVLRS